MRQLWRFSAALALALGLCGLPATAQQTVSARPGAVNYVEGNVTVDGKALTSKSVGSTELAPGQVIRTEQGKAEVLLTPGVFLRLGDWSAVEMVSPSLTNTQIALQRGRALVEVDQIQKENHLEIADNGTRTVLEKKGIYEFNADQPSVAVYDGKAVVQKDDRLIEVGKSKELSLIAGANPKPQKFAREATDDLYAWSKLRSEYMAEANVNTARTIVVNNPGWYYGTGWYWNPWFDTWTFVPGAGYLYSPFGFGFYSPSVVNYYAPPAFYGYRGFRGIHGAPPIKGFHGTPPAGGFRGAPATGFRGGRPAAPPPAVGGSGVHFGATGRR